MTSSFFTTSSGTKTHFLRSGTLSGPLLVCLHGLGGSTETFAPLLPSLPTSHDIVLVDFQGFGVTPLTDPSKPLFVSGHVADLHDLITSLQAAKTSPSPVTLIGHSLGGVVSLHYAAAHPDVVGGLLLLAPGRSAGHIPVVKQRMLDLGSAAREKGVGFAADIAAKSNFYEDTPERAVDPEAREAVRRAVAASDAEGYARTCEAMVDESHKDPEYRNIKCPSVFIAGDKDMIAAAEKVRDLSTLVGGSVKFVMVQSGHQPILEDLEGVKDAVTALFEGKLQ
ncbi:Alpha/Beta hydrolase protein [Plectosphaerella plurivora]|uniref:Alpha/Beta hydrolase protein n=1 Tax=Plectosphaerella plurivora TaxID=936078 RepID=A0A9P8V362_9PEZI|nr:Alpha/Beta hydrolase protein [Plectosphaerella plurivora]